MDLAGIPFVAWFQFLTTWDLISVARVSRELRNLVYDEADPPDGVIAITGRVPYGRYLQKIFSRVRFTLIYWFGDEDNLRGLNLVALECGSPLGDTEITTLTNVRYLTLYGPGTEITDEGLRPLQNLTYLDVQDTPAEMAITDVGLSSLTNLVSLAINSDCGPFTDHSLSVLTNLTYLKVGLDITDEGLRHLVNLTHLDLEMINESATITGNCFSSLTRITTLNIARCSRISNENLCRLTNLTALDLHETKGITDEGIASLTKLTHLDLSSTRGITGSFLRGFQHLRTLILRSETDVRDPALWGVKVQTLDLFHNDPITDEGLLSMDLGTLKTVYWRVSLITGACVTDLRERGIGIRWWQDLTRSESFAPPLRPPVGSRPPDWSDTIVGDEDFSLFGH